MASCTSTVYLKPNEGMRMAVIQGEIEQWIPQSDAMGIIYFMAQFTVQSGH